MDPKAKMDLVKLLDDNYEKTRKLIDSYKDEVVSFKDGVYDKMDKVYGELLKVRDEQFAHSQQHDNVNGRLDKLESAVFTHRIQKKR